MSRVAQLVALGMCLAASAVQAGALGLPPQIGGAYSVPVKSLREGRFAATIRQQYDFSCGSAALSTLLTHHYGVLVSEDVVFESMFRLGDQAKIKVEGFSLLDMKRYLATHGFEADGFQESLDTLSGAGIPAIVLINERGYNHFVVIKGLKDGRVLIGDPSNGTRAMPVEAFRELWRNQILFVVSNRRDRARFNADADWLAAPSAPLATAIQRDMLVSLPRRGPSDF